MMFDHVSLNLYGGTGLVLDGLDMCLAGLPSQPDLMWLDYFRCLCSLILNLVGYPMGAFGALFSSIKGGPWYLVLYTGWTNKDYTT
ncbi:hypothetical protein LIER_20706 [Lithospermum erythrorhizon]|uniref:Uncharacterized protein n=1 Tax=Lithospermum erythrorhizon TaxID=34254 RepID=A0AAV3QQW2_LITER